MKRHTVHVLKTSLLVNGLQYNVLILFSKTEIKNAIRFSWSEQNTPTRVKEETVVSTEKTKNTKALYFVRWNKNQEQT